MTIPITYKNTMQTNKTKLLSEEVNEMQAELKKASQGGNAEYVKKIRNKQNKFNLKYGITGYDFLLYTAI